MHACMCITRRCTCGRAAGGGGGWGLCFGVLASEAEAFFFEESTFLQGEVPRYEEIR